MPETQIEEKQISPEITELADLVSQSLESVSVLGPQFERLGSTVDMLSSKLSSFGESITTAASSLKKQDGVQSTQQKETFEKTTQTQIKGDIGTVFDQFNQIVNKIASSVQTPQVATSAHFPTASAAGPISTVSATQPEIKQQPVETKPQQIQPQIPSIEIPSQSAEGGFASIWNTIGKELKNVFRSTMEKIQTTAKSQISPQNLSFEVPIPTAQTLKLPDFAPTKLWALWGAGPTSPTSSGGFAGPGGAGGAAGGGGGGFNAGGGGFGGGGNGRDIFDMYEPPWGWPRGDQNNRGGGYSFMHMLEMMNPFGTQNLAWFGMFAFSGQLQPATMALSQPTSMAGMYYQNFLEGIKQFGASFTGLPRLSNLFQQIIQTDAFDLYESMHQSFTVLKNVYSSTSKAEGIMGQSIKLARETPLEVKDLLGIFSTFGVNPEIRGILSSQQQLSQLATGVAGLSFLVPEQGTQGAIFAIREALAGQFRSIKRRFNIDPEIIASSAGMTMAELTEKPVSFLEALDIFLKQNLGQQTFSELQDTFTKQVANIYDSLMGGIFRGFRETNIYSSVTSFAKETSGIVDKFFSSDTFGGFFQRFSQNLNTNFTKAVDVLRTVNFDTDPPENVKEKIGTAFNYVFSNIIKETTPAVDAIKEIVSPHASKLSDALITNLSRTVGSIFTGMIGAGVKQTILLGTTALNQIVPTETLKNSVEKIGEQLGTFSLENPFSSIAGLAILSRLGTNQLRRVLDATKIAEFGGLTNYLSYGISQVPILQKLVQPEFISKPIGIGTLMLPQMAYQTYRDIQNIRTSRGQNYESVVNMINYNTMERQGSLVELLDEVNATQTLLQSEKVKYNQQNVLPLAMMGGGLAYGLMGKLNQPQLTQIIENIEKYPNFIARPLASTVAKLYEMSPIKRQVAAGVATAGAIAFGGMALDTELDISKEYLQDYRKNVALVHTIGNIATLGGLAMGQPLLGTLIGVGVSTIGEYAVSKYYQNETEERKKVINQQIEATRRNINNFMSYFAKVLTKQPEEIFKTLSEQGGISDILQVSEIINVNQSLKRDEYLTKLVTLGDLDKEQGEKLKNQIVKSVQKVSYTPELLNSFFKAIESSNINQLASILNIPKEDLNKVKNQELIISATLAEFFNRQQQINPALFQDIHNMGIQYIVQETEGTPFGNILRTGKERRSLGSDMISINQQQQNIERYREALEKFFTSEIIKNFPKISEEKAGEVAAAEVSRIYELEKSSNIIESIRLLSISPKNFYEGQVMGIDEYMMQNRKAAPRDIFQGADERIKMLRKFDYDALQRLYLSRSIDMFGEESAMPWIGYRFSMESPQLLSPELFGEFSLKSIDFFGNVFKGQYENYEKNKEAVSGIIKNYFKETENLKPVIESRFNKYIENTQQKREELINKIDSLLNIEPVKELSIPISNLGILHGTEIEQQTEKPEAISEIKNQFREKIGTQSPNEMRKFIQSKITESGVYTEEQQKNILEELEKSIIPSYNELLVNQTTVKAMESIKSINIPNLSPNVQDLFRTTLEAQEAQNLFATMQNYVQSVMEGISTSRQIAGVGFSGLGQIFAETPGTLGYTGFGGEIFQTQQIIGGVAVQNPALLSAQREMQERSLIPEENLMRIERKREEMSEKFNTQITQMLDFLSENPEKATPAMLQQINEYTKLGASVGLYMTGEQRGMLAEIQAEVAEKSFEVYGKHFEQLRSPEFTMITDILAQTGGSRIDMKEVGGKSPIDDLVQAKDGVVGALKDLTESLRKAAEDIDKILSERERAGTPYEMEVPRP